MTYRDIPEIAARYKSKRWQALRKEKKMHDPFCERCKVKGIYEPARIVHHKEYITLENYLDDSVFFNIENLESLCQECHNKEHFRDKEEYFFDNEGNVRKC